MASRPLPHSPLHPSRCPLNWDTCQTFSPQTSPMSQLWGHRAGIAGITTGKASPPGRHHHRDGTAAGIKDLRRLKTGRCGGLWGKALLAPGFCLKSFPRRIRRVKKIFLFLMTLISVSYQDLRFVYLILPTENVFPDFDF